VKPSNILLDTDYNALVADFSLARLLTIAGCTDIYSVPGSGGIMDAAQPALPYARPTALVVDRSGVAYRAPGTRAPNGLGARPPSQKSDVYSFGVVLLQLLTGKAPQIFDPHKLFKPDV
jgi:serine/threonine protein kinase